LFDNNSDVQWASISGTFITTSPFTATSLTNFNTGITAINGSWIKISLDQNRKFNYYCLAQNSTINANPVDFTLYASTNSVGTTWVVIDQQIGYNLIGTNGLWNANILLPQQECRHIALVITRISGNSGQVDIRNMEIGQI
jgi:hypothetical protein